MTFSKFCRATQYVQKTVLLFHGTYLLERKVNELIAVLYQVDDFYVEVFFRDNSSGIYQLKSYADVNAIDAYLNMIDIGEITELL
jgi:lipoate-protein ligase A